MKVKLKSWDDAVQVGKQNRYYGVYDGVECVYGFSMNELPWGEYVDVDCAIGELTRIPNCLFDYDNADILRYGEIITDDELYDFFNKQEENVRIRLISYGGFVWYHKMVDGDMVECRKVGRADDTE